ncbi:hypothetical protein RHMOL_Rhmol01G0200500 [Rhododendron molle]|uniref:Uncharacterized protein n=1 Tax=Rhododendron molle TaxID=49168 RepID=A0ACC0Q521_RHOML|nr:hypothetical protein RHMOL_Rhmol01G0200500 [Rhododendron molle]
MKVRRPPYDMLDAISNCARSMAKNSHKAHNVGSKVLPMIVSMDSTNYVGADTVHVDVVLRESIEGTVGPRELLLVRSRGRHHNRGLKLRPVLH